MLKLSVLTALLVLAYLARRRAPHLSAERLGHIDWFAQKAVESKDASLVALAHGRG